MPHRQISPAAAQREWPVPAASPLVSETRHIPWARRPTATSASSFAAWTEGADPSRPPPRR